MMTTTRTVANPTCIDCGAPIAKDGEGWRRILCVACALFDCEDCHTTHAPGDCPCDPDTYDGPIPSENEPHGFNRYGIMVLVLLLCLLTPATSRAAEIPAFVTNVPAGCAVTRVWEDHSAWAVCAGGYVAWMDPDTGAWDIPVAIDTLSVGPDSNGNYHDWPVLD